MIDSINFYTLLYSLIIAIVTALLSSRLTIRKYRTNKWWDKKLENYIDTITAMNKILMFCDDMIAREFDNKITSNIVIKKLKNGFDESKALIDRQLNIGELLISKDSYKDLLKIDRALSNSDTNNIEDTANLRVITEGAISFFVQHAKKDLSIKHF